MCNIFFHCDIDLKKDVKGLIIKEADLHVCYFTVYCLHSNTELFLAINYVSIQMIGISTDPKREKFLLDHGDWIAAHGGIPNVWQISEKNAKDMAERLIKHHIFYRYIFTENKVLECFEND